MGQGIVLNAMTAMSRTMMSAGNATGAETVDTARGQERAMPRKKPSDESRNKLIEKMKADAEFTRDQALKAGKWARAAEEEGKAYAYGRVLSMAHDDQYAERGELLVCERRLEERTAELTAVYTTLRETLGVDVVSHASIGSKMLWTFSIKSLDFTGGDEAHTYESIPEAVEAVIKMIAEKVKGGSDVTRLEEGN